MTAGFNVLFNVEREIIEQDSWASANVISGILVAKNIRGRIEYSVPKVLTEIPQGQEYNREVLITIKPIETNIKSQDKIYIVRPETHSDYRKVFRVTAVENTSMHPRDRRGFLFLTALRIEEFRSGTFNV